MIYLALAITVGRILYVSPEGNDAADGLSPRTAWRTLERVSKAELRPGDTVELASGARFEGSLTLQKGGNPQAPISIRTRGEAATIYSPNSTAITILAGGIEVSNLRLLGGAQAKKEKHAGISLWADGPSHLRHIRLRDLEVKGFGAEGISIYSGEGNKFGFEDVLIERTYVAGNYGTGIASGDGISFSSKNKFFAHRKVVVRDCDVSNNLDGNGIILSGIDGGIVEYCRADGNTGPKGALGMWSWCAKNMVFRYNIASRTRGVTDGGGYDLDGGSENCIIENCLSFENEGPGGMHCDFPDAPRTQRNVMRRNISINDGRKAKGEPFGFGYVVWGSGLYDCLVQDNLVIQTVPDAKAREFGALFANFLRLDRVPLETQRLEGARFVENQVLLAAPGYSLTRSNFPSGTTCEIAFTGNEFFTGRNPVFIGGPDAKVRTEKLGEGAAPDAKSNSIRPERSLPRALEGYERLKPRDLPKVFKALQQEGFLKGQP